MKTQTPCPTCQTPMTLLRMMLQPIPWSLKCKGCQTRFGDPALTMFVLTVYTVAVIAVFVWLVPLRRTSRVQSYGLLLAIAIPAQVLGCLALLRWGKFVARTRRSQEKP